MLRLITPLVTIGLLAAVGVDQAGRQVVPAGVEAYHKRVRESEALIPYNIGNWIGTDATFRQETLNILDANSIVSRGYRNLTTGTTATLLLVQCADARSLLGHYPPVCYPSQGWSEISSEVVSLPPEYGSFSGTKYLFSYKLLDHSDSLEVLHFTVLPDGQLAPDMGLLDKAARDRRYTFCGGASVQFVISSGLSEVERSESYAILFKAAWPWISVVQSGLKS